MGIHKNLLIILFVLIQVACGVKGDPLPPERPAELGRGKPTYKRAAERVKLVPQSKEVLEEPEEEDSDSEFEEER